MLTRTRDTMLVVSLLAALALSGVTCMVVSENPPHRPPDGYVYTGLDIGLVYAASLDVYYVSGHPNCYYYRGHYYRRDRDRWKTASKWRGNWKACPDRSLPPGLAKRHHG